MKKYLPVALALAFFATAGAAPAFARTIHHPAYRSGQLYMYAPGGYGYSYRAAPFAGGGYPNPIPHTGTRANAEELGPAYPGGTAY
jgi:hypothetical protein